MVPLLIVLFMSASGVSGDFVGEPCEEALASLRAQRLEIRDVDLTEDLSIIYTLHSEKQGKGNNDSFAVVECGVGAQPDF